VIRGSYRRMYDPQKRDNNALKRQRKNVDEAALAMRPRRDASNAEGPRL
jgi:hypothetical protein